MCDPVTITAIAAAAVTAGGQIYGGLAANAQGKYEQQIANQNAALEQSAIKDAQARQAIAQQQNWRKVSAALGMQRAQAAALGLDVNFGSPGDLQSDTLMIGYEDSSTINSNFASEVKGYDINAANDIMQGRAARSRGKQAMIGGFMSAAGTLLGSASQIAGHLQGTSPPPGSSSFGSSGYSTGGGTAGYFNSHPFGS